MRKKLLVTLALGALLAGSIAAMANAASTTIRAGNLILRFGGNVSPVKLPKNRFAPIALTAFGSIRTSDGTHPSAFRQAVVDIDRNGALNTRGVPVCRGGQLIARNTGAARRVCGRALVGAGNTSVEISFPEQAPINVQSPLSIFNGGTRGRTTTMYIHAFITVPVPAAIVTTLKVTKIRQGRFGHRVVARVPVVAGGSGSVLSFRFTINRKFFRFRGRKHTYLYARCQDGRFFTRVRTAAFRNETNEPGVAPQTNLRGGLLVPCRRR